MKKTYIIGEVGQNHNGSVDIAKLIIDLAARKPKDDLFDTDLKGLDAIKLTKRNLDEELTDSAMNRPYNSPHSFGKTYGEHRAFLELSNEQHKIVYSYAKEKGLDFIETLCSVSCLDILKYFTPDKLKVASRDLTNLPLLEVMAQTKIPIILSTGMANQENLNQALEIITKHHDDISILHCLSQYPAEHNRLNLKTITYLKKQYPQFKIGYSDHSIGIMIPTAAVSMGAEIIEKHITIDRNMKGSDQRGSLGPDGVKRMVRDIRILEQAMGKEALFIDNIVNKNRIKLERSIASNKNLSPGDKITESDIHLLSPGDGYKWYEKHFILGKKVTRFIPANEIIYPSQIH
jgi:sialic acid synthase